MSYILEYAKSDRSVCKGPERSCPSEDRYIDKGELRLGVDVAQTRGITWKHWVCVSPKVIANLQGKYSDPDEIPGWDEVNENDQERIQRAWDEGEIPEDDLPESVPVHFGPKSKRKGSVELPATNDDVAKESSQKRTKQTAKNGESSKSKSKNVKEETPDSVKQTPEPADEAEVKEEGSNKKSNVIPEEPKVAKYARANKTAKEPKKSRGEPTRRSARIPAMKKEEESVSVSSALAATKRKSTTSDAGATKRKTTASLAGSKKAKKEE